MESVKTAKLKIEIREVTGCGKVQPSFEVSLGELKNVVQLKDHILFESLEFSNSALLVLTAFSGEKNLGSAKISISSLFADKLAQRPEKWLKIKTEEFQNFRVKITASLSNLESIKESAKPSRPSTARSEKAVECPYLSKLQTDASCSTQPLDDLWKNRNVSNENSVKISFEANSAVHESLNPQTVSIENLNFSALNGLNGLQLKQAVRLLCDEVKQLDNISKALPDIQENFKGKVSLRKDTGNEARALIESQKEVWEKEYSEAKHLVDKRKDSKKILIEKQEESKRLEKERDFLRSQLSDLQKSENFEEVQDVYKKLIESSERHRKEISDKIGFEKNEIQKNLQKTQQEIFSFQKETEDIQRRLKVVTDEYQSAKSTNSELKRKIITLQSSLENQQDLEKKQQVHFSSLKNESLHREKIIKDLLSSSLSLAQSSETLSSSFSSLTLAKSNLADSLKSLNSDLESTDSSINSIKNKFLESVLSKISNEQICCLRADLSSLLSDLSLVQSFYLNSRPLVLPDLDRSSELLSSESEKILVKAEQLDQMIEAIDRKEEELDSLKNTMGEVKKRQVFHVPVKNDPVDLALADYVNSKEVPVKFLRQEFGNYLFGSMKIFVKLENNKLLVKVRGGFTPLEEFIDIYSPIEAAKSDSRGKSPISRP